MKELRYTLLGDGTSDKRLLPVLSWLVERHTNRAISASWADLSVLPIQPRSLADRVACAAKYYPCDLLFVHRDAETESRNKRMQEIESACSMLSGIGVVGVVPIRMQEAWLLIDEGAIRRAAGKPNGKVALELPRRHMLEAVPNPKQVLYSALRSASELSGRHLDRFKVAAAAYRVSELIPDYAELRGLSAFDALEGDLQRVISEQGLPM